MDMKTILLIVALGGTNALQALGFTVPAEQDRADTMATLEFTQKQLDKCLDDLRVCYSECGRVSADSEPIE